jgi:hypothetical protein
VWGRHDAERRQSAGATAENEDLIDYAAVHSLANGAPSGAAAHQMPAEAPA